jgi:hypothetical protein
MVLAAFLLLIPFFFLFFVPFWPLLFQIASSLTSPPILSQTKIKLILKNKILFNKLSHPHIYTHLAQFSTAKKIILFIVTLFGLFVSSLLTAALTYLPECPKHPTQNQFSPESRKLPNIPSYPSHTPFYMSRP